MRTSELAKLFAVHPNTVRLYEEWGYLPPIPRDHFGQREFAEKHVEQMRLARLTLHDAPRSGPQFKGVYKELVWLACADHAALAVTRASKHLAAIRAAYEQANHAAAFLRGVLPESIAQATNPPLTIQQAASFVGISIPILRRWEFYGLIQIPRSPQNNYRIYGKNEIGWLLVVQSLRQAGYTMSWCSRLINPSQHDHRVPADHDLCDVLDDCLALFIDHEDHTTKVLDQLQRMTTAV